MAKTKFYISYRSADDFETTKEIYYALINAFDSQTVLFSAGLLEIPDGFDALKNIHQSDAMLVMLIVIGQAWAAIGRERFNDPHDYVRLQLEQALSNPHIKIVPILINDAKMPTVDDLPPSIQALANIQALTLPKRHIQALPQMLIQAGVIKKRNRQLAVILGTLIALFSVFVGGVFALNEVAPSHVRHTMTPTDSIAIMVTNTQTDIGTATQVIHQINTARPDITQTATGMPTATGTRAATQAHQTHTARPNLTQTPSADSLSVIKTSEAITSTAIERKTQTAEIADSPTPDAPITATFFPQEVSLVIVNHGGAEIGEGTFRIYSTSNEINLSETVRVDLEVRFDSYYITPTPAGGVTKVPVASPIGGIPTSASAPATATPTPIYISDSEQVFYQAMGATLNCSQNSFTGCTQHDDVPMDFEGHTWSWILKPVDGAIGIQDLLAEVWIPQSVNGEVRLRVIWKHDFQLRIIRPDDDSEFPVEIIVALIGFLGVILATILPIIIRNRSKDNVITPSASSIKIFINYRRDDSSAWATHIASKLMDEFGENAVFRDIHGIKYGDDFEIKINEAVWSCDVFIAVIGKQWLTLKEADTTGKTIRRIDNPKDFVRLEILAAQSRKIRVIPALVDGAEMPSEKDLPRDLKPLAKYNAIRIRNDSSGDDINRLIRQLKTAE